MTTRQTRSRIATTSLLAFATFLSACGAGGDGPDDGDDDDVTGGQPPEILWVEWDEDFLGEGGTVTFDVQARDVDGDLEAVWLSTDDGTARYAELALVAENPEYSDFRGSVSWDRFHEVQPIDLDETGREERELLVVAADRAGHEATDDRRLYLTCDVPDRWICEGSCTNLFADPENCGECGNECTGLTDQCHDFTCKGEAGTGPCMPAPRDSTCGDFCESIGRSCSDTCEVMRMSDVLHVSAIGFQGEECTRIVDYFFDLSDCGRTSWPAEVTHVKCCCM